jgi:hypothetical protein
MMNKSLLGCVRESSHKDFYGFHAPAVSTTGRQVGGFASARLHQSSFGRSRHRFAKKIHQNKNGSARRQKRAAVSGGF